VSKLSRVSRALLIIAAVVGVSTTLFLVTTPDEAQAAANCTYYSNASFTVVVGQFGVDCCNNPVAWGRKTKFAVCGGCFPCVPPPR
jgi:hypothetical protein